MILDVGCGILKRGDINVDIAFETDEVMQDGIPRRIYPDILASGNCLPFKDECFETVIAFHVIEHSTTPHKFFAELVRVSKRDIFIRCPHIDGRQADMPHHISFFDEAWFEDITQVYEFGTVHITQNTDKFLYLDEETTRVLFYPYEVCVFISKEPMELVYSG